MKLHVFSIDVDEISLKIIKLMTFEQIISENLFFSNFGMRPVASPGFVFMKNDICVVFQIILSFSTFFRIKKDAH